MESLCSLSCQFDGDICLCIVLQSPELQHVMAADSTVMIVRDDIDSASSGACNMDWVLLFCCE